MSDLSAIPRYGLRKRPANDVPFSDHVKRVCSFSPSPDAPPEVMRRICSRSGVAESGTSTLAGVGTSAPSQEPLALKPSTNDLVPHQLTINDRTFTGPLPPNRVSDPSQNAANLPDNHGNYKLFVCADCSISQEDEGYDLHDLCYESHPCIWSFPPKAREAYANRRNWLELDKPLEETRLRNGRLPRLLDEAGESITRGLIMVQKGADLIKAYDEMVKWRYRAVISGTECCENRGMVDDDRRFEERCAAHRAAREAMLENMSWSFEW
jgi:hypothetical protein